MNNLQYFPKITCATAQSIVAGVLLPKFGGIKMRLTVFIFFTAFCLITPNAFAKEDIKNLQKEVNNFLKNIDQDEIISIHPTESVSTSNGYNEYVFTITVVYKTYPPNKS